MKFHLKSALLFSASTLSVLMLAACFWSEPWQPSDQALPPPPELLGIWESTRVGQPTQQLAIEPAQENQLRLTLTTGAAPAQELTAWLTSADDVALFSARQQLDGEPARYFLGAWQLDGDSLKLALASDAHAADPPFANPVPWLQNHATDLEHTLETGDGALQFQRVAAGQ